MRSAKTETYDRSWYCSSPGNLAKLFASDLRTTRGVTWAVLRQPHCNCKISRVRHLVARNLFFCTLVHFDAFLHFINPISAVFKATLYGSHKQRQFGTNKPKIWEDKLHWGVHWNRRLFWYVCLDAVCQKLRLNASDVIVPKHSIKQVRWLSALSEIACGQSTRMVAPRIRCFCVYVAPPCEWRKKMAFWRFLCANFATIKYFLKSKCVHHLRTKRQLCAKFDVFKPTQFWDIVWRIKLSPTQTPTQTDIQLISPSTFILITCAGKNVNASFLVR